MLFKKKKKKKKKKKIKKWKNEKKKMLLTFIGRVTVMVSIVVVPILVPTRVGWLKKMKKIL